MGDNEFYVKIWKVVAVCFCVLVLTVGSCNTLKNNNIKEAVANGESPIAARCMYPSQETDAVCITYVLTVGKK